MRAAMRFFSIAKVHRPRPAGRRREEYPAVFIPVMTQYYAMLQQNLLYTGFTRGVERTKVALVLPTVGTRKEYHSRRTNSVCATKAEGLTPSCRVLQASARGGAAVHRGRGAAVDP